MLSYDNKKGILKILVGLGAGLLPWYGWPEILKNNNTQFALVLSQGTSVEKVMANPASQIDPAYLKRSVMEDIIALAHPDLMRRLIKEGIKPKRNVVLAFWSAEEMGFVGSYSILRNPTFPKNNIEAVFNVDTVGNGPV